MRAFHWSLALLSPVVAGCLDASHGVLAYKDTASPAVLSTRPAPNEFIARTQELLVTFSEPMDSRTLGTGILVLRSEARVPIAILLPPFSPLQQTERNIDDLPYTVTVRPISGSFDASVGPTPDYVLVLTTALTDEPGNALAAEVQVSFGVM
jgi:hypothetical protein